MKIRKFVELVSESLKNDSKNWNLGIPTIRTDESHYPLYHNNKICCVELKMSPNSIIASIPGIKLNTKEQNLIKNPANRIVQIKTKERNNYYKQQALNLKRNIIKSLTKQ